MKRLLHSHRRDYAEKEEKSPPNGRVGGTYSEGRLNEHVGIWCSPTGMYLRERQLEGAKG
jgi:hypothetical protein